MSGLHSSRISCRHSLLLRIIGLRRVYTERVVYRSYGIYITQTMFTELLQVGISLFLLLLVGRWIFQIVYNLFFHPLSKIPGPWFAAISDIPYCWWLLGGRHPYKVLELHNKYGHAVRLAPNEVSFNTSQSWKDIYGHRAGHQVFVKGTFYQGGSFSLGGITSIISERRPEVHKEMRNLLASSFSERAVGEQEKIVAASVDKLVRLVGVRGSGVNGIDLTPLFQSMTFDITGNLAFGESFGALDNDVQHPWISTATGALQLAPLIDAFNHYPTIARFFAVLMHREFKKALSDVKANEDFSYEAVQRRRARETDRKDFLTRILQERDEKLASDRQIAAHASDLVIAGSDTAATALAAIIYFLLQNPYTLEKLTAEVRGSFKRYSDITYSSTTPLQYLHAIILEGMRIYPPVPFALPRIVPEGGDIVDGCFLPGGATVYTNPVATCLSSTNFQDPWSFKPERWIEPSNDIGDSSQPFSLGPRTCLGRALAWLELQTTLAKLIWVYDLQLVDPNLDWHGESRMISLWKKPALMIRATNRGVEIE
ncbi:benzoate 4-monooxygenase cytochrome P450 [Hypoxylon sp. FL0890]|nr:benzoate 4-monooxygenase cytochrome P450 [Hypoxylon sp. FL0890]